jgi:hypothetical protein
LFIDVDFCKLTHALLISNSHNDPFLAAKSPAFLATIDTTHETALRATQLTAE